MKKLGHWWLPLGAILFPGLCYAIAAVYPSFNPLFAGLGILLTIVASAIYLIRAFQRSYPASPRVQWIITQLIMFSGLLLAVRLWLQMPTPWSAAAIALTTLLYVGAWSLPYITPKLAIKFYRDVWHPRSLPMKILVLLALSLGGGTGGAALGMRLRDMFGDQGSLIAMGIGITFSTIFGSAYFSTGAWRLGKGLPIIPKPEP